MRRLRLAAAAMLLAAIGANSARADSTKEHISGMVRALGYGGAIHHFKNYMLRAKDTDRVAAGQAFTQAAEIVAALQQDRTLGRRQQAALQGAAKVIALYQAALPKVAASIAQGKTPREIDQAVQISDGPAISALVLLRGGHRWSKLEELEYALGYGGAIHAFKNYVLRGADKYHIDADKGFAQLEQLAAGLRSSSNSAQDRSAAAGIGQVVKAYRAQLSRAKQLVASGQGPQAIDATVKVSDAPALAGLRALRR